VDVKSRTGALSSENRGIWRRIRIERETSERITGYNNSRTSRDPKICVNVRVIPGENKELKANV